MWLVLATAVLTGASAGMMDAGLNTAVALTGRQRLLNLLHGAYGVARRSARCWSPRPSSPAPGGPPTWPCSSWTWSWRASGCGSGGASAPPRRQKNTPRRRRTPSVLALDPPQVPRRGGRRIGVFFVYTGLEVGAGQWEASFCRGHLNMSAGATGLATFGYWGR